MTLVALSLAAVIYANAAITHTPALPAEAHPPAVSAAQPVGAYATQPPLEVILGYAGAYFSDEPEKAQAVTVCEMGADLTSGAYPEVVFDLDRSFGGPMQIGRGTWGRYFWERYGWTWEQLVLDLDIHFQAAREIRDRAGNWAPWPYCGNVGGK